MALSVKASWRRHLAPAAGTVAAILLGLACAPSPRADVLATWRGGRALVADLESFIQGLPEDQRRPAPGRSLEDWVGQWLRQLAVRDLMTRRAREGDGEDDPGLALRARYLASMDIGRRFVRERCPDEPIDEVDEAEVQQVHARRVTRGAQPWILVRHIFRKVSPEMADGDRARLRAEMTAILAELRRGASFVEMARRHSDSETAEQGGLIGRISRQAPMDPAFVTAAWKLADREMSEVLELAGGFHIVLREDSGVDEPS
jgi:hypothetical protein